MFQLKKKKIHNEKFNDLNVYQYHLYTQYHMDKHANSGISQTLLRIFYALTSPDYDIKKGIKKVFNSLLCFAILFDSKLNQMLFCEEL